MMNDDIQKKLIVKSIDYSINSFIDISWGISRHIKFIRLIVLKDNT